MERENANLRVWSWGSHGARKCRFRLGRGGVIMERVIADLEAWWWGSHGARKRRFKGWVVGEAWSGEVQI
mgnify:CR=1 FL=1